MQDIAAEAAVSLGALYVYFESKEALIAGLCERDRAEFAERFDVLEGAQDFVSALKLLGEQYFVDEPAERRLFVVEMGVEATRNPRIAEIYQSVDRYCCDRFRSLFQRLKEEGRIEPERSVEELAMVFSVIGEGLFWRRAVHPDFDAKTALPAINEVLVALIKPKPGDDGSASLGLSQTSQKVLS
jgi:AcrR family transcriptional regulator